MNAALLTVIALGLVSLGVAVTWLLATRVPMSTLTTAQEHGRFAGLGAASQASNGVGRTRPVAATPALQPALARA